MPPETQILTRFGVSARTLEDSPRDSPGDFFLTVGAGEGFDSSARGGVAILRFIFRR